jgi:hypothetical protein
MEYKLRTFCQIAEKLGSEKIIIEYINNIEENTNIDVSSYQTGLYFLNFKSNEGISDTVKIFKK